MNQEKYVYLDLTGIIRNNHIMKRGIIVIISVIFCIGCTKDVINLEPARFEIEVTDIGFNSATVSWTESIDPEEKTVQYDVYLNDEIVASDILDRTLLFDTLTQDSEYRVKIIASDNVDNLTEASTTFRTIKNLPPLSFEIEVSDIGFNSATVSWTESIDPEEEMVKYDVYLNDEIVANDILDRALLFDTLTQDSEYRVKIIASDYDNNQTESTDIFTTEAYTFGEYIQNGFFENTDTSDGGGFGNCNSIPTHSFNILFPGNTYFGASEALRVLEQACANPQEGNYSVEVSPYIFEASNISFALSQPLQSGETYTLSFYYRTDTGSEIMYNELEIGYSNNNEEFGTQIKVIKNNTKGEWQNYSFSFTPSQNYNFLTVRILGTSPAQPYQLDSFKISK